MIFLRWIFVSAPARACARAEDTQGRLPWLYVPISFGPLLLGGLLGSAFGWTVGDLPKGAASGVVVGLAPPLAWWGYVGVFAAIQWFRGRRYAELAGGVDWNEREKHWYDR